MKVYAYDFDQTIYNGDSSADFYMFCLSKNIKMLKYIFKQIRAFFQYKSKKITKTEMKECFFQFLKDFDNVDELVEEFWNKNYKKIKNWYLEKDHSQDIIISASPEFLLKVPCEKLKVMDLIASEVDKHSGKFLSPNCHDKEKVVRLNKKYKDIEVLEMYTDSKSDMPMIDIAKHGYMVKKDKITKCK